jgi:hypothetical protein
MSKWMIVSVAACFAVLLSGGPATADTDEISAKVPFAFVVGNTVLPAGQYTVRASWSNPSLVWIVSPRGRHVAAVDTTWGGWPVAKADLKFAVYGRTHFLSRIDLPGEGPRRVALTPKEVEGELARLAAVRAATTN